MSPLGPQGPVDSRRSIISSRGWVKTLNQEFVAETGETVRPGHLQTLGTQLRMEGTSVLRAVPPGCTRTLSDSLRAGPPKTCCVRWPRRPDGLPRTQQSPAPRRGEEAGGGGGGPSRKWERPASAQQGPGEEAGRAGAAFPERLEPSRLRFPPAG